MYINDREGPWLPRSDSSKQKGCSPTFSNVPIQWVIIPPTFDAEVERLVAAQLADKWQEVISNGESGQTAIINVSSWLSRATLDAYVGESRMTFMKLTGPNPALGPGLLNTTSALWKASTTNSRNRIQT